MDPYAEIVVPLQGLQTVRYSELASSMIILYDHFITLDQEVELIWKSGWSFGKCLFLLNRYYTLFVVIFNNYVLFGPRISATVCTGWFRWQGATGITAFILGELILQLRLYALYDLNKKVLAFMGAVFLSAVAASTVIMGRALSRIQAVSMTILDTSLCTPLNLQDVTYFYAFWIPIIVSESVLCGLAIFRAFQGYRRRSTLMASGRALVRVLIRDSILYFVIMLVVYLCNTILFLQNNVTYTESAISYAVSMSCVMGNRLCLNVRGMIWREDDDEYFVATGLSSFSAVRSHGPLCVSGQHERTALSDFEMRELRSLRTGGFS